MNTDALPHIATLHDNNEHQEHDATSLPDLTALTLQQDPWEICFPTRVLASFLKSKDLCHLSACGQNFLPFRAQIQRLSLPYWPSSIVGYMAAGGLTHLTTLKVDVEFSRARSSAMLATALSRLPRLQHLSLSCRGIPLPALATILNSLVKSRLKSLFLKYVGLFADKGNESMFADALQGFHNLEILDMENFDTHKVARLAVDQMENGEWQFSLSSYSSDLQVLLA